MQSPRPTLFLTCGLPGSGKTALARRLEAEVPALRLTADEWLHEFYPTITTAEAEEGTFRGRVERVQWPLALRALQLGCDVVLDWGLWSREERDLYRTGARDAGARVVLCLLDPSVDELCGRLARRNADRPFGAFEISKEDLLRWAKLFQRPTDEELELYDNWQADCDSPRSSLAWPARFGVQSQMAPFGRGRGRLPMGTQGAQPQVQDAAVASGATRKAPLALQILCLIWAAFIIVENVGQIRWNWPTGSSLPGGTIGLRRADILGDGYVRINVMKPGGPMARAGVAPGDKVRFDRPYDRVRRLQVGESVGFTLVRAGRPAHMQVTAEHRTTAPETTGLARLSLLYEAATGIGALFGAFIVWRSRRNPTTLLLGAAILDYGTIIIMPQLWESGPRVFPFVFVFGVVTLSVVPILFYAFAVSFYRDCVGPGKPWERLVFWAYTLVAVALGAVFATAELRADLFPIVGDGEAAGAVVSYVGFAICLTYLFLGWRRSAASVQQRYAIMLAATVAIILAQALDFVSIIRGDAVHYIANTVLTAVVAYPLFAYAILRNKVFDLGFAVNRTLVYGVVSVLLLAAFGLVEWATDHFVPIQGREKNAVVDAAIAVGVFLTFHRVRDGVEHVIERLFFRRWQKAEAELRRFVRAAAFFTEAPALTKAFAKALGDYAEGARTAVYLARGRRYERAAGDLEDVPAQLDADLPVLVGLRADPKPVEVDDGVPGASLIAPMVNRNEVIGGVVLGPKPSGASYRPDEIELIGWATRQVGLDLHALRVEQLEASQADLNTTVAILRNEVATLRSVMPQQA